MFERLTRLVNKENVKIISQKKVLLVGVGGVGGFVLECLVRSGFHYIDIIDHDVIEISNLNRQIISNQGNIGHKKIDEAMKRAKSINPELTINGYEIYVNKNTESLLQKDYDFIIDACDSVEAKALLIAYAQTNSIHIISCMGTANRLDPNQLYLTTLDQTENDPLAKKLRNEVRKQKTALNTPVVFSKEIPRKQKELGTIVIVPMVAAALCTFYVIKEIIKS